jgi:hypothetical protein
MNTRLGIKKMKMSTIGHLLNFRQFEDLENKDRWHKILPKKQGTKVWIAVETLRSDATFKR